MTEPKAPSASPGRVPREPPSDAPVGSAAATSPRPVPGHSTEVPTWIRLRIAIFGALITGLVGLLLDVVIRFVLPLPTDIAANARQDILWSALALVLLVAVYTALELRAVARVASTVRLGLAPPEAARQKALRAALSFPVTLPLVSVGAGTLGNLVTFVWDLLGRSHAPWYALHTTVICQVVILCGSLPAFVFARFTLRPFVVAVVRDGESLGRAVGLRGRVALLLSTLVALVAVSTASLASMRLDRQGEQDKERRMRRTVAWLAEELTTLGPAAFERYLSSVDPEEDVAAFLQDAEGRVFPALLGSVARQAGIGGRGQAARTGSRDVRVRLHEGRIVLATPVRLGSGGPAWVGVAFAPSGAGSRRLPVIALVIITLLVGLITSVLFGAGVAREVQAVAGRIEALGAGRAPEPLSAEVGSLAEVGRLVDAVNDLLAAAGQARVRGFLEAEASVDAARSKMEFLANMSHDLRSPLTSILGFVEFLQKEVNGPLDEAQRRQVGHIADAAKVLVGQVEVLLASAKQEAGRLTLLPAWTPVAAVVSRGLGLLADRAGADRAQRVATRVEPGLPALYLDTDRTAQALDYLMEELLDLGPTVALTVEAHRFVDGRSRGVELVVSGVGPTTFDPDAEGLFEPLRPSGARLVLRPGPGLARAIVMRQQGTLEPFRQETSQGEGPEAGFRLRFPPGPPGERPGRERPKPEPAGTGA